MIRKIPKNDLTRYVSWLCSRWLAIPAPTLERKDRRIRGYLKDMHSPFELWASGGIWSFGRWRGDRKMKQEKIKMYNSTGLEGCPTPQGFNTS